MKRLFAGCLGLILAFTGFNLPQSTATIFASYSTTTELKAMMKPILEQAARQGTTHLDLSGYRISGQDADVLAYTLEELKLEGYIGLLGYAGTGYRTNYEGYLTDFEISYDKTGKLKRVVSL